MGAQDYFNKITYNDETKKKIIDYCIQFIEEHGTVRVGFAAKQILGVRQQPHIHKKIAAALLETGKYVKEPRDGGNDFDIYKYVDFKKLGFWGRHPFYEKVTIALISAGLTYLVSSQVAKTQRIDQRQIDKQQDSLIKEVSESISILQNQKRDSSTVSVKDASK